MELFVALQVLNGGLIELKVSTVFPKYCTKEFNWWINLYLLCVLVYLNLDVIDDNNNILALYHL